MDAQDLTQAELLRYSRHLILPEVGLSGQKKLKAASVLLVGSGGLGSPVALYLAAAGVGRIGVVDYDRVEESNLQRQILHGADDLNRPKVESARKRMLSINPFIQVDTYNEVFSSANAEEIAAPYDILVDGTDNFPTRYLINDLAVLTRKPYVYGAIFRFEGQASVFAAGNAPCYRCLFPDPPPPDSVPSCAEGGVLGVLPGTIGSIQATETIKLILGIGESLAGRLLLYDALTMSFESVQLRKNPACKVCSEHPEITHLIDYEQFCGVPAHGQASRADIPQMEPREVLNRLAQAHPLALLDVRDPVELEVSRLPGALVIPSGQVLSRLGELDASKEWVVFCRTGDRSARVVRALRERGFRAVNLKGGINAWAEQVDPSLKRY